MIAKQLQRTLARAVIDARERRHDMLCLEHLLRAMVDDPFSADILSSCGADLDALLRHLEDFLNGMETVPDDAEFEVQQTVALTRVLQRAAIHVQSAGKEEIDAGDILAAMYHEPDSHAVYLLKMQGITRLDILDYISHGIGKGDFQPAGPSEDDDELGLDGPAGRS